MPCLPLSRRSTLCLALLLGLVAARYGCYAQAPKTEMVAMGDGVKLATDVYLPTVGKPPYPAILIRTPYGKVMGKSLAPGLTPHGYAVVVQDMRGRFDSEGHHAIIFGNDGLGGKHRDGHDTIRWVVAQPWSDGKVATWGGSALAIAQNMAAPEAPEALKGQVVIMGFSDYYHQAAYQGGVWRKELLEGWLKGTKMDDVNLPTFLAHPTCDDFWKALSAEAHADQVDAPGVFIGGWYDIFLQGTINSFVTIQDRGRPNARGRSFLVVGPFAHGGFNQKLDYPDATRAPINVAAPMDVLASWLKGGPAGAAAAKPVHYYVMGDTKDPAAPGNFWRSAAAWPPPADVTPFYLHVDRSLAREKPGGAGAGTLAYRYDPQDPVPTVGGQNLFGNKGPMDQTPVESRPDVLTFTTATLAEPVEVTGRITARLRVASDCPDTDFTVKLCDVFPDGKSMLVTDGIRRASLRNGFEKPEPLAPGEVYVVDVDLWSTSLVFNKGHRIRVSVSSSNSPRFEPNANTGDPHPQPGKTRVAANTVHLSAESPSQILLPLYNGPDPAVGRKKPDR